jgi:hypothetical protein
LLIDLVAEEGRTYDYSCRVRLSGLDASQASAGDYVYLKFSPYNYAGGVTETIRLAEGQTVVQPQDTWLYFTGRYTHQASSADQPQMAISLSIYGEYAGTEITIDDVSVCEVGGRRATVSDALTGQLIATNTTQWVDDFLENEQKIYRIDTDYSYAKWLEENGLSGSQTNRLADLEPDGLDNLMEYALGGNPTNDDAANVLPVFQILENGFYYAHNERTDDPSLIYTVELSTNLVSNVWKTNGLEFVGSADFSNVWETVTNRTDIGEREFIRLKVEEE